MPAGGAGGGGGVAAWMPAITSTINVVGNLIGGLVGAKPPIPPAPVVPPPEQIYKPVPGPPGETRTIIEYRTHAPDPAPPETLTYLGIIALVLMVFVILACSVSGIGFYFWQNQRMEAEKRANESRESTESMESGHGGRRGRRGRTSGQSRYSTTSGTSGYRSTYSKTTGTRSRYTKRTR